MQPMPHRGRWQAQGTDIPKGGHSVAWKESAPLTKAAGLAKLVELSGKCEARQRSLRESACKKAKRWVRDMPKEGYSTVGNSKPFYIDPKSDKYKNARIDLEIHVGIAFVTPEDP